MMVHRTNVSSVCLSAVVRKIYPAGPLVRIDLATAAGEELVVKISQPRHRSLNLKEGETVFVTPGEMEFFRNSDAPAPT